MTLVVIWPHKKTALHIASDSRLSSHDCEWDYGPKIFRLFPTHDHLAYCGTSALALSVISQATAVLANTNTLQWQPGAVP